MYQRFRFYEFPDLQRSIDILIGIIVGFILQQLWERKHVFSKRNLKMAYYAIASPIIVPRFLYYMYKLVNDKEFMDWYNKWKNESTS